MRAVAVADFGATPEMMELPAPEAGPGEILVRLRVAGVNPFDWKAADGAMRGNVDHHFPMIMGSDGAGVVEKVGPGVSRFKVGDAVYGQFMRVQKGLGSYADYAVAEEHGPVSTFPEGLPYTWAAALPTASSTAYNLVETTKIEPGTVVLVNGATGGVGQSAVQLAANKGAHVIGTTEPEMADYLMELGAMETVDFTRGQVVEDVMAAHPGGIDVVIDLVTTTRGDTPLAAVLRRGGIFISTLGAADPDALAAIDIQGANLFNRTTAELLGLLAELADGGRLKIRIEHEVRLEEAPETIAALRSGKAKGKTVIVL
ncbi:NADPH:quinone reductase-like Zn-dependent oxidoreductase [Actinocorallia herbida]|uniref:NADPH:quinone reductase-like Zn-dependent oxidoreductase n=1 Tax=Actinocorallia herbida TaxID=58109 RepID=A0A3N1CRI7_9ACTN|nr:NADP-dependent oxidoreductase [Actinocorallia herbida]ROO83308.1 NADPH:quinone reductase-like Zn-dependent oxidoreductase [Actinocorallia herbida]